ncbi:MAG TPA: glycosyltransferase [Candidatus Omnitrophota bacterium]|nr:glycosyltransferase [Candidatus Omnitrophota bacterium]
MTEVSVIIPARNEEKNIAACLNAVFGQKTSRPLDVIVIDSGSTDRTLEILKKYKIKLVQIKTEEFRHSTTRNLGARNASGKYLVFLNADALPADDNWLEGLLAAMENDRSVAGAFSRQLPRADCPLYMKKKIEESFPEKGGVVTPAGYSGSGYFIRKSMALFSTVSAALRREVWEKIPFDDRLDFAEDQGWARAVLATGYSIAYVPASRVYHSHDYSPGEWFKLNYMSFSAMNRVFERGPYESLLILPALIANIFGITLYAFKSKLPAGKFIQETCKAYFAYLIAAAARTGSMFRTMRDG